MKRIRSGGEMTKDMQEEEVSMLRTEIEMLMGERDGLLRTVGAAAVFVAHMEPLHVLTVPILHSPLTTNLPVRQRSQQKLYSVSWVN